MISLCITTYQRTDLLFESFRQVINDDRISEIVIVDDASTDEVYNTVAWYCKDIPKVKLHRNGHNIGCYRNKAKAVSLAFNDWVVIFDSDNTITSEYIDSLYSARPSEFSEWYEDFVYQPIFAKPHFNFIEFENNIITKNNVAQYAHNQTFCTALNAFNYFVNRDEFLRVWEDRAEPWTADSILHNYNWLKAGNSIYFCPGLEYDHKVHDGSHYKEHHRKTGNLYNEIVQKLKTMQ